MARIIPNNNTWIGFIPVTGSFAGLSGYSTSWNSVTGGAATISQAEIDSAYDLTPFVISITAQSTGNTVPTPTIDSLFEGNIPGTVNASFTADFYRDDATYTDLNTSTSSVDFAWNNLARGTKGYVVISRFNNPTSVTQGTNQEPASTNVVELWPVVVTARTAGAITSNTVQTFTITAAVPQEPAEGATVAGTAAPSKPNNLTVSIASGTAGSAATASIGSATVLTFDWDAPSTGAPITGYKVYKASNTGLTSGVVEITSGITKAGTVATVTTSNNAANFTAAGTWYVYVVATNAVGDGAKSGYVTITVTA
jgi:hypothetical protein